jgi:hypothetical protein
VTKQFMEPWFTQFIFTICNIRNNELRRQVVDESSSDMDADVGVPVSHYTATCESSVGSWSLRRSADYECGSVLMSESSLQRSADIDIEDIEDELKDILCIFAGQSSSDNNTKLSSSNTPIDDSILCDMLLEFDILALQRMASQVRYGIMPSLPAIIWSISSSNCQLTIGDVSRKEYQNMFGIFNDLTFVLRDAKNREVYLPSTIPLAMSVVLHCFKDEVVVGSSSNYSNAVDRAFHSLGLLSSAHQHSSQCPPAVLCKTQPVAPVMLSPVARDSSTGIEVPLVATVYSSSLKQERCNEKGRSTFSNSMHWVGEYPLAFSSQHNVYYVLTATVHVAHVKVFEADISINHVLTNVNELWTSLFLLPQKDRLFIGNYFLPLTRGVYVSPFACSKEALATHRATQQMESVSVVAKPSCGTELETVFWEDDDNETLPTLVSPLSKAIGPGDDDGGDIASRNDVVVEAQWIDYDEHVILLQRQQLEENVGKKKKNHDDAAEMRSNNNTASSTSDITTVGRKRSSLLHKMAADAMSGVMNKFSFA